MPIKVFFFAAARERAGQSSLELPHRPGLDVGGLLEDLERVFPTLASLRPHLRVAVNQQFAEGPATLIPEGAEVALIPPVAGGSGGLFRVVDRSLVLQEVVDAVSDVSRGGLVTFSGAVRNATGGRAVVRLEYEAYAPMAEKKLAEIAAALEARYPGVVLAVVHRVGVLEPGDLAVVIAAAAPHRADAFRACSECIDWLKRDVPIWKKEVFADGEVWVGLGP